MPLQGWRDAGTAFPVLSSAAECLALCCVHCPRYPVVPTVTVLAIMKARLTGATKGHALLKKKVRGLGGVLSLFVLGLTAVAPLPLQFYLPIVIQGLQIEQRGRLHLRCRRTR